MSDATGARPGPLAGLRVVAVEHAVAAPLCSRHLADLGAEVIKVERVDGGDFARQYDDIVEGFASHFVWLNRGKRSVAVDLKTEAGSEILFRLLDRADVLVSNLGPGALDRLLSWEALEERWPKLIRCDIVGYGTSGPFRDRKAFDLLVQGEAGVTMSTGTPGRPAKPGVSLADLGAGIYAATAILAAVHGRAHGGGGAHLEISMFDVMCEWMMPILLAERAGTPLPPAGTRHPTITPYGPYETGDGAVVNIAIQNDRQWKRLCEAVLELPDLASDERFRTNSRRQKHRSEVERLVGTAVRRLDQDTLEQRLDAADVPWGRLNPPAAVVHHPQLAAANRWVAAQLPNGTRAPVLRSPFDAAANPPEGGRVPTLGADTVETLQWLGYADTAIEDLRHAGIVA